MRKLILFPENHRMFVDPGGSLLSIFLGGLAVMIPLKDLADCHDSDACQML